MKFRTAPRITPREAWILIAIGLLVSTLAGVLIAADIELSRKLGGGGQFFTAWRGARAFLLERGEPYSLQTARAALELALGRTQQPSDLPYFLNLPFFLLPAFFPLALIPSATVARGLWMSLGQAALGGAAFIMSGLLEWRPSRTFVLTFSLVTVFGVYSTLSLLEGTPIIMLVVLLPSVLWAYLWERDELAGAMLAVSLFAWEATAPFLILVFLRIFHDRRWRILAGFGMALTVLLVICFLIYPGWYFPFLAATLADLHLRAGTTTTSILQHLSPTHGIDLARATTALVMCLLVFEWAAGRGADFRHFIWTSCLVLAATPLLGVRTSLGNMILVTPAMFLIYYATALQHGGIIKRMAPLTLLVFFATPWLLLARAVSGRSGSALDYLYLFLPASGITGLYWIRWWFIHPRRTLLEQARAAEN